MDGFSCSDCEKNSSVFLNLIDNKSWFPGIYTTTLSSDKAGLKVLGLGDKIRILKNYLIHSIQNLEWNEAEEEFALREQESVQENSTSTVSRHIQIRPVRIDYQCEGVAGRYQLKDVKAI